MVSSKLRIEASNPVNMPIPGGLATLETIEAAGGGKVRKFNLLAYTGGKAYIPGRSMPVVFDLSTMKLVDGMPVPLLLDTTTRSRWAMLKPSRSVRARSLRQATRVRKPSGVIES